MTKGTMGRMLAASQAMSLTESNAFTNQRRTCYDFNTQAGIPTFYQQFDRLLGALLHPDYTDEEIRREVRNFGVTQNAATHNLHLEEKGSVYNEMVASTSNPFNLVFRQLSRDVYGPDHPFSRNSGGEPAGLRAIGPEDIRRFHHEHYFLANMGAVVSLPHGETLAETLAQFDRLLNRVQVEQVSRPVLTEALLPIPKGSPNLEIQIVDYPSKTDQQPSFAGFRWPAGRKLEVQQELLLEYFLGSFAGGAGSNLYRLLLDSKTRKLETGAQGVFGLANGDEAPSVTIGIFQIAAANLNPQALGEMRDLVVAELARIAEFPDGSPELLEFNQRVLGRALEDRRRFSKLMNTPPRFGARNTGSEWMDHLHRLNREPGFRKFITMKPELAAIEQLLKSNANIWHDLLPAWHLTGITPYSAAARPSPALLKEDQESRTARADAEVRRLETKYGVTGEQEAIARYRKDYDAQTVQLDELASKDSGGRFLPNPPLTLDANLEYHESWLPGSIPVVESVFDNMTSITTALELRLDGVSEPDLPLLSLLPALVTQSGVIENGKPIAYPAMAEEIRKQILSMDASFDANVRNQRVELRIQGTGNDLAESRRAIDWIALALFHPDWRPENLPRLRDLVNQQLARLRATQQNSEEGWVQNPILAYYLQSNPLYLTTSSFLTRAYNADRLRWMLADAGSAQDRAAAVDFLDQLADAGNTISNRAGLSKMLKDLSGLLAGSTTTGLDTSIQGASALSAPAARVIKDATEDLSQLLTDLPDKGLASDWAFLCRQMARDLSITPTRTLAHLDALRVSLLKKSNARLWLAGSRANEQQIRASLEALVGGLETAEIERPKYTAERRIENRLKQREPSAQTPRYVGLLDENLTGGTVLTVVPFAGYNFKNKTDLVDLLTARLFAGHGPHTLYTKTNAVGLAYSNGIRGSTHDGWLGYYAERAPEIPQTLSFAVDVVKRGARDSQLSEYTIAQVFSETNSSKTYEERAAAIASDLVDGLTPDKVRQFRQSILKLRKSPSLATEIFSSVDSIYGQLLPGYSHDARRESNAVYYMIGSDKQFTAMEAAVQSREKEHVYKLYPRDYWLIPAKQ